MNLKGQTLFSDRLNRSTGDDMNCTVDDWTVTREGSLMLRNDFAAKCFNVIQEILNSGQSTWVGNLVG